MSLHSGELCRAMALSIRVAMGVAAMVLSKALRPCERAAITSSRVLDGFDH